MDKRDEERLQKFFDLAKRQIIVRGVLENENDSNPMLGWKHSGLIQFITYLEPYNGLDGFFVRISLEIGFNKNLSFVKSGNISFYKDLSTLISKTKIRLHFSKTFYSDKESILLNKGFVIDEEYFDEDSCSIILCNTVRELHIINLNNILILQHINNLSYLVSCRSLTVSYDSFEEKEIQELISIWEDNIGNVQKQFKKRLDGFYAGHLKNIYSNQVDQIGLVLR
ncbi:hypothetical protein KJ603_00215 [Patescibacteria group bacterium]|nr:hypothetical protein [Patescibacteria group bacterium]